MGVLKVSYTEGDLETTLEKEYDSRPTFDEAFQFMHNVAKLNDFEEDEDVFDCDGNCDECEFNEDFDDEESVEDIEGMIVKTAIESFVEMISDDTVKFMESNELFNLAKDSSNSLEELCGYMLGYNQALQDMRTTMDEYAGMMIEDGLDYEKCPVCGSI